MHACLPNLPPTNRNPDKKYPHEQLPSPRSYNIVLLFVSSSSLWHFIPTSTIYIINYCNSTTILLLLITTIILLLKPLLQSYYHNQKNHSIYIMSMYVVKRNGRRESVHFDKITSRVSKLCYGLNSQVRIYIYVLCVVCMLCVLMDLVRIMCNVSSNPHYNFNSTSILSF